MLSGNQLINTVQSLPEADINEVVKTCGYISTRKDGTQKLNFNDFYIALLTAKANQYRFPGDLHIRGLYISTSIWPPKLFPY